MDLEALKTHLGNSNLKEIESKTGISRGSFYNFLNNHNVTLDFLKKIEAYFLLKQKEDTYYSLKFYGAPIALLSKKSAKNKQKTIAHLYGLKKTAQRGLTLASQDAFIESIYPFFLYKNIELIDLQELYRYAVSQKLDGLLGYHLEIVNLYSKNTKIISFLKKVRALFDYNKREKSKANGLQPNRYELLLCKKNATALEWGLYINTSTDDYLTRFRKWDEI